MLHTSLIQLMSNGTAKTKLTILAFLYFGEFEFVKNLYWTGVCSFC